MIAPDGRIYSSEQGSKSDDELNLPRAGSNCGWPRIAGFQDGDNVYDNQSAGVWPRPLNGRPTDKFDNAGAILAFRYPVLSTRQAGTTRGST